MKATQITEIGGFQCHEMFSPEKLTIDQAPALQGFVEW